jgi:hypothetical protein
MAAEGWTMYAPLGADPDICSFCLEPRRPRQRLIANADASAAICEQCVVRFAGLFAHSPEGEEGSPSS